MKKSDQQRIEKDDLVVFSDCLGTSGHVLYQLQLAGSEGMAKAEARFGKPLHKLSEGELATGREEAVRKRKSGFWRVRAEFPPEYYAYAAEGNRRCQERRRKQKEEEGA